MTNRLAENAAHAIEQNLEERGLMVVPRRAGRVQVLAGKEAVKGFDASQAWMTLLPDAYKAMLTAAPVYDAEEWYDIILKVITETRDA